MKRLLWLVSLGTAALLVSCSGAADNQQGQDAVNPDSAPLTGNAQNFAKPLVAQSARPGLPVVPGLLQPTNAKVRVPAVASGRTDPFAPVPSRVVQYRISAKPKVQATAALPRPSAAGRFPNTGALPPITMSPLPPLPAYPMPPGVATLPNSGVTPLPPVEVPIAPPSPTALAEAIEVTGILQVGNKWSVIVKEPGAHTSRYVSPGDYLENGKVLVKKIVAPTSTEPMVVLQQGGKEIMKSIGSNAIASR
ncbi:hypothetical protein [Pantanalinema sp. GBBB05]|uniref:hypothetical protein n=1 Tax=Pantanalinema sp. GBBB05 TaxID=2604139 RepID=UPI001DE9FE58|nr:hypothetical protein [Pantanalinema sp. GBBB05]